MDGPCDYGHFDIVLADFLKKNAFRNQSSEKQTIYQVKEYIQAHYGEDISLMMR